MKKHISLAVAALLLSQAPALAGGYDYNYFQVPQMPRYNSVPDPSAPPSWHATPYQRQYQPPVWSQPGWQQPVYEPPAYRSPWPPTADDYWGDDE